MIWDRFDDAHDAVLDRIDDLECEIRDLQAALKAAGLAFDPYRKPAPSGKSGPQGWYEDTCDEEWALRAHRDRLRGLLPPDD
ncbi:MAG: hypothetical protein H6907_17580 [Hyphomicrobiales bacterium]|nr:hypothetical protein [Hyphomicrobiales bacterium]